jgi:two-component sensor histidine kinase
MDKQTQIKNQMIELQLEIGRDQQVLHETKNRLKDRMAILYALTAELDQIQIQEAEKEIDDELAKYPHRKDKQRFFDEIDEPSIELQYHSKIGS